MDEMMTLTKETYDEMVEKIRSLSNEESFRVKNLESALKAIEEDGSYKYPGLLYAWESWVPRQIYTKDEMTKRLGDRIKQLENRSLIQRILNEDC